MRLFVALDMDEAIRQKLAEFVADVSAHTPSVRFVGAESFHVTLKFIGETDRVDEIRQALAGVHSGSFEVSFRGFGFFPAPTRPRVFWAGIEAGPELAELSARVNQALHAVGFAAEAGPYRPHLTLARSGSGSPRGRRGDHPDAKLHAVQQYLSAKAPPEFGTMTAHEFFLFESVLSPRGATYKKIERYPLA